MHLDHTGIPEEYTAHIGRKITFVTAAVFLLAALLVASVCMGAVRIPAKEVLAAILGGASDGRYDIIIWQIRMPQALTAIAAGAGLAAAGAMMQSILRNPLGSPFTLGISHAAAFGAALSVMIFEPGSAGGADSAGIDKLGLYTVTFSAFVFSLIATFIIIAISRARKASPEVMVLAGVALGSLFTAGTMFLQYFADDVELAAMVFWTFGDVGRASWSELGLIAVVLMAVAAYGFANRWNYNAIDAGDETARGLGVRVEWIRLAGMLAASLITAVVVSFLGIIGFVGLVCPHMVRRLIGDDHRFLLPGTCVAGALLLLAADTAARLVLAPHVLPVSILTSFLGAPVFIYLIIRGYNK
ncbi:MAG: FecCD family ABC transporter permease [Desulfosalsimonas sp.]